MISYREQSPTEYDNLRYNFLALVKGLTYWAYSGSKGRPRKSRLVNKVKLDDGGT